jgi:ATP-dependent Lon protease
MDNNTNDNEKSPKSIKYIYIENKNKKNNDTSDSTSDEDYDPETDNCNLDNKDYQQFLYELFPSKYLKNKIKSKKNNKNKADPSSSSSNNKKSNNKKSNNKKFNNKKSNNKKFNNKKSNNKKFNNKKSNNKKSNNKKFNNKKSNKIIKKKAFNALKKEEFPTDEDDMPDEQDDIDMKKSNFSIVYTFGDNDKILNKQIYGNFKACDETLLQKYNDDDEDYEYNDENNTLSEDSDIDFDEEEYEENKHKNADEVTEDEWEKMFLLEEKKMKIDAIKRKKMIKNLSVGAKIIVKKPLWENSYVGTIKKISTKKTKKGKKNKKYFEIKLDNNEYEIIKNAPSSYIIKLHEKEIKKSEMSFEIKELLDLKNNPDGKFEEKIIEYEKKYQDEKDEKDKKSKDKKSTINIKRLRKLLKEKNISNDFTHFKKMEIDEQRKILKNLVEMNKSMEIDMPYRLKLISSDIDPKIKSVAMKKVNMLNMMDPCSGEYYKNKLWVDTFMSIPFGKHNSLPVKYDDGVDKCRDFMENAKETLDNAVYGLNDAKMQIMQMLGGWISNPNAVGTAIAIHGPMGTGKTTLVKEGISKILNRPFAFIPLGGATDSSFLEGHSYTYEGSVWGKIVDVLIHSKCMNPVFYFDELDKISNTPKGEEITGILTHLTDTTQNSQFHDKYFSNLDFDVSKALFIFSYNHEEKVNPILKDRMYRIETKGYEKKDKKVIANKYLIPSIMKNINFKKDEIMIEDEVIEHICDKYTGDEMGVRNLKRCLEIIYGKLNLFRLMKSDSKLFDGEVVLKVEFPFTVTTKIVDQLIKEKEKKTIPFGMYM